jgi:hypothetical protein
MTCRFPSAVLLAVLAFTARAAGFSVLVDQLRFSWTRVARSVEFSTAAGSGSKQRFYSLNLGYEF